MLVALSCNKIDIGSNEVRNIIALVGVMCSIVMLIFAMLGVFWVNQLRKKQQEAAYGFYLNLQAQLERFNFIFGNGCTVIPAWVNLLGYSYKEKRSTDNEVAFQKGEYAEICAKSFHSFLCSVSNQVPPCKKTKELLDWDNELKLLRKRLLEISMFSDDIVFVDWERNDIAKTHKDLCDTINSISTKITKYRDNLNQSKWTKCEDLMNKLFHIPKKSPVSHPKNKHDM